MSDFENRNKKFLSDEFAGFRSLLDSRNHFQPQHSYLPQPLQASLQANHNTQPTSNHFSHESVQQPKKIEMTHSEINLSKQAKEHKKRNIYEKIQST